MNVRTKLGRVDKTGHPVDNTAHTCAVRRKPQRSNDDVLADPWTFGHAVLGDVTLNMRNEALLSSTSNWVYASLQNCEGKYGKGVKMD